MFQVSKDFSSVSSSANGICLCNSIKSFEPVETYAFLKTDEIIPILMLPLWLVMIRAQSSFARKFELDSLTLF